MNRKILVISLFSIMLFSSVSYGIELMDFLRSSGNLSRFRSMLPQAKWGQGGVGGVSVRDILLKRLKKYTLFIPTDYALNVFGKVGFLKEKGREELFSKFIKAHMVEGRLHRKDMKRKTRPYKSVGKSRVYVDYMQKVFYVFARRDAKAAEKAKILYTVETDNGVVHVIDKVLIFDQLKENLDAMSRIRLRR